MQKTFYFLVDVVVAIALLVVLVGYEGRATSYPESLNLEKLTVKAERIILGTVLSRTTGIDPLGLPATVYTFQVEQVLKGTVGSTITLKQIGVSRPVEASNTGVITFPVVGMPVYRSAQRYVLFLNGTSEIGFTSPVGLDYGAFTVLFNEQVVNGLNNAGLFRGISTAAKTPLSPGLLTHKRGPIGLSDFLAATQGVVQALPLAQAVVHIKNQTDPRLQAKGSARYQLIVQQFITPQGNPIALFNGNPFRWNIPSADNPGGSLANVPYDTETGTLGNASNASAIAKVAESFGIWSAPSTTAMVVTNAPGSLGVDVDANCPSATCYLNWFFVFGDNLNPIIFDNDGSITNAIAGDPCAFGGLGGNQGSTSDGGLTFNMDGSVVLDGAWLGGVCGNSTLNDFGGVFTHENGHFLSIGHTIINGELVIANESFLGFGVPPCASVEMMLSNAVPCVGRPNALHKDDVSIISHMYPDVSFAATTAEIDGRLFDPDGVTPVNCGNVIVRKSDDPFFDAVAGITGISNDFGTPPPNQAGSYRVPGLTTGAGYTVGVNQIPAFASGGSSITALCDPVPTLSGPEEFYNGAQESGDSNVDNPGCFTLVTASGTVNNIDIILNSTSTSSASCAGTAAVFRVEKGGNVFADGAFNAGGADLAERIDVSESVEPGDVVEFDPSNPRQYRKARGTYSPLVAGVISTLPGFSLANRPEEMAPGAKQGSVGHEVLNFGGGMLDKLLLRPFGETATPFHLGLTLQSLPMSETPIPGKLAELEARWGELGRPQPSGGRPLLALMGRVYVKATAENGPIAPGDLLTVSSRPGYAMRCADINVCKASIVGKALQAVESGEGLILVLVMSR